MDVVLGRSDGDALVVTNEACFAKHTAIGANTVCWVAINGFPQRQGKQLAEPCWLPACWVP